jgi:AcrR family transcriptional regulator
MSVDTKTRILDTAERLFAAQGFAATSLRSVTSEAGVNLAAVHYHFGSKEGLIRAVFGRRFDPVNTERLELLEALEAGSRPTVEQLLGAFIRPATRLAHPSVPGAATLGALVGRLHTEPGDDIRGLLFEQFAEVSSRFLAAFGRALPDLGPEELVCRFHFVIAAMAATLAEPRQLVFVSNGRVDPLINQEPVLRRLEAFLAAGLKAPGEGSAAGSCTVESA